MRETNASKPTGSTTTGGGQRAASLLRSAFAFVNEHPTQLATALSVVQGLATVLKMARVVQGASPVLRVVRGVAPLLGFGRRSGPGLLGTLALASGAAVLGVGVGVLFAPSSGEKTRRKLRRRVEQITADDEGDEREASPKPTSEPSPTPARSMTNGASRHAHAAP